MKLHTRTHIYLLLFVCGDVSLNPGPIRHPCGVCNRPVAKNIGQFYERRVTYGITLNVKVFLIQVWVMDLFPV